MTLSLRAGSAFVNSLAAAFLSYLIRHGLAPLALAAVYSN